MKTYQSVDELMHFVSTQINRVPSDKAVLYIPGNAGRQPQVGNWIFDNAALLNNARAVQTLSFESEEGLRKAASHGLRWVTSFAGEHMRKLINENLAGFYERHLSQLHVLFQRGLRPTVAVAHVSPPDAQGRVTLGLNAGLDIAPVKAAHIRVAVINKRMPRFYIDTLYDPATHQMYETGCAMHLSDFDAVVEVDDPLHEHNMHAVHSDVTDAIADHILSSLQKDASASSRLPHTLQLGIGAIPDAFASRLASQGVTIDGIWSETFSKGVLELYRKNLIANTTGEYLRERIVVGFVLGTTDLYATMHSNPDFIVLPQEIVNDPAMIKYNEYMVSLNTAFAASVRGEVAASTQHLSYYSGVGGQHDFALGATWAEHGRAFIAMPSLAHPKRSDTPISKIVSTHQYGTHCTISSDLPVELVTEHGCADLRDIDSFDRVKHVIRIAHPSVRRQLAKAARLLPAIQGVDSIPPQQVQLADESFAIVRPARQNDIPHIDAYIRRLSVDDLQSRYMSPGTTYEANTKPERLRRNYDELLDFAEIHAAFVVEQRGEIIGVTHAFGGGDGTYEISFSRRSDMLGLGIGDHLMRALLQWGVSVGADTYQARAYTVNKPMHDLFDRYGYSSKNAPRQSGVKLYSLTLDSVDIEQLKKSA